MKLRFSSAAFLLSFCPQEIKHLHRKSFLFFFYYMLEKIIWFMRHAMSFLSSYYELFSEKTGFIFSLLYCEVYWSHQNYIYLNYCVFHSKRNGKNLKVAWKNLVWNISFIEDILRKQELFKWIFCGLKCQGNRHSTWSFWINFQEMLFLQRLNRYFNFKHFQGDKIQTYLSISKMFCSYKLAILLNNEVYG